MNIYYEETTHTLDYNIIQDSSKKTLRNVSLLRYDGNAFKILGALIYSLTHNLMFVQMV